MEAIRSFETLVHIRTVRRYIPENVNFHNYRCEILKTYKFTVFYGTQKFITLLTRDHHSAFPGQFNSLHTPRYATYILQMVSEVGIQLTSGPRTYVSAEESWFTLYGYVNSQNNRYLNTEIPHALHEVPRHVPKFDVWCVQDNLGPCFFHQN
jgi:hypothetical protein